MKNSSQDIRRSRRSTVRRVKERGTHSKADIYPLIDELKLGHLGFEHNGQVTIIPMTIWRVDDYLYFHTLNKSRLHKMLDNGQEICVSFAECDEWVLSKSAYHHSANYRSAVLFCRGEKVADDEEFDRVFEVIINQIEAGRWSKVRPPNTKERKATALMRLEILDGSFKSRKGGPNEEPEDLALPVWNGTVPVRA